MNIVPNQRFGAWTVLERDEDRSISKQAQCQFWICHCDCGTIRSVVARNLSRRSSASCGCLSKSYANPIVEGARFGRWTALKKVSPHAVDSEPNQIINKWLCQCDCGNKRLVASTNLRNNSSRSCGCLKSERTKEAKTIHGQKDTRLYRLWAGIKARCFNPNVKAWEHYGGRGISLCQEWANDFSVFAEWAKENGYKDNLTIERRNVDGGYCPENCLFITQKEQGYNKRNTVYITAWSETKTIPEWFLDSRVKAMLANKVTEDMFRKRLRRGWTIENAAATPNKKHQD